MVRGLGHGPRVARGCGAGGSAERRPSQGRQLGDVNAGFGHDLRTLLGAGSVLPRYRADWIGAVVPGALADRRPAWFPGPARDSRRTVVVVVDGLGARMVQRFADVLPTLRGMAATTITAAAPSTTVAGLTSISTGAVPAVHGLVGYRFRIGGQLLAALQWRMADGTAAPNPETTQPLPAFLGRRVAVVNRKEFMATGFTRAHLRGAPFYAWSAPTELVNAVAVALDDGYPVVYAYDDRVDKAAHTHGLADDAFFSALSDVDATITALLERLSGDVCVLITADHGQVPAGPSDLLELSDLEPYVAMMGGDARFRSLHAATGAARDLVRTARERFSDVAVVLTREEVVTSGVLGGRPALSVASRVGDVVLIGRAGYGFIDPTYRQEADLKSMHGGLSADEMEVPLLAATGRVPRGRITARGAR